MRNVGSPADSRLGVPLEGLSVAVSAAPCFAGLMETALFAGFTVSPQPGHASRWNRSVAAQACSGVLVPAASRGTFSNAAWRAGREELGTAHPHKLCPVLNRSFGLQ